MVQRNVGNYKLGIQAKSLKTEKKLATIKPSLQIHDGQSKGADSKGVKMKKSRSIKRSDVEISLRKTPGICRGPQQPEQPPPIITRTKTPNPLKPLPCKSPYTSPNYMKSTSSSEARKERTTKVSNPTSTSKLHRAAKTLAKISSHKKMRILTKPPSFKHTRPGACKKVVLCHSDLDVQRGTCSSTLKHSKFPTYLKLKPGATEAEGNSVFKVCPYTYCSLNGHHISAPPLKLFLSSRRRLLKTLKVRPDILSPRKAKVSEKIQDRGEGDQNEDFFIEVFVPDKEVPTQVSETLPQVSVSVSDGLYSKMDFQDDLDQTASPDDLSGINFTSEEADYPLAPLQKLTSFESQSSSNVSLEDYFGENSDMEWEEGSSPATDDKCEFYIQTDKCKDRSIPDFELDNSVGAYLQFLADEYPPHFQDEIVECLSFSDSDYWTDRESTWTGNKLAEELVMVAADIDSELNNDIAEDSNLTDKVNVCDGKLEDESINQHDQVFPDSFKIKTETQSELRSYQDLAQTFGDESGEEKCTVGENREDAAADIVMGEREPSKDTSRHISSITDVSDSPSTNEETSLADNDYQAKTDQSESGNEIDAIQSIAIDGSFLEKDTADWKRNEANNGTSERSANSEDDSKNVELSSGGNNVIEVRTSEMRDHQEMEADVTPAIRNNMQEAQKQISNKGKPESSLKLLDSCSTLKGFLQRRRADEDKAEDREFNPHGPNFLTIEPEPEAERVDLRHQEMDERRNAEEWMLDHALQKTVNQLAPARKRKVALLVEAFESVLPIPKFESHLRRKSSSFASARPIACS